MSDEMTREQARDTLRNAAWLGSDEERELIEKAVELLCGEPCEDAISRADAEALFRTARSKLNPSDYKTADEFNTRDLMLLNAEQMIHLLPSVTPQEPKASNSENPNKCEDAISRQAAYDLMQSLTRWCVRSEDGKFNNVGLLYDDVMFGIDKLPSVTPKQSGWHYTDLPPSDDPYKRYLVVYSPYDRNYGRNTAPRFEIADYYKGDGLYNDKPWHLTISHSVMEKEILAWKDIGIVDEVMQGAKMFEPQESEE